MICNWQQTRYEDYVVSSREGYEAHQS